MHIRTVCAGTTGTNCDTLCMSCSDWHDVRKVKIGSKIPHDPHSFVSIEWKVICLSGFCSDKAK